MKIAHIMLWMINNPHKKMVVEPFRSATDIRNKTCKLPDLCSKSNYTVERNKNYRE